MKKRFVLALSLSCLLATASALAFGGPRNVFAKYGICKIADVIHADDPDAKSFFHDRDEGYDDDLYCAAKRIAAQEPLSVRELDRVKGKINQLLGHGADPYLPLKRKGPDAYDCFISKVAEGTYPIATEILKLYLKHGGDPNYRAGVNNEPLVASTALMENFDSYKLLIEHGADVWKVAGPTRYSPQGPLRDDELVVTPHDEKYDRIAIYTAARAGSRNNHFQLLDYAFDKGFLRNAEMRKVGYLVEWIGSYQLRDDEISRNIVRRIRRVLQETHYPGNAKSAEVLEFARDRGW